MPLSETKDFAYQINDVTFFTVPKPFEGGISIIQRNAIRSWIELGAEIILCGDEPGVKETASEYRIKHIRNIDRNEYGTPFLNSVFEKAKEASDRKLLCYVNSDIIFLDDFTKALKCVGLKRFLMTGLRLNIFLKEPVDFSFPKWGERLKEFAVGNGKFYEWKGIDYFLFTRDEALCKIPPFVVGRPPWDNWYIYNARLHKIPVIDCTGFVTAIHQDHDYRHVPKREEGTNWEGPEADYNRGLCKGYIALSIEDVDYLLSGTGALKKVMDRKRQSACFLKIGLSFRRTEKLKALSYYFKSLFYRPNLSAIKAILKLFLPGYYKKRNW
ncbi:MAG: hypothetical protein A2Z72_05800 [Omnitrophica bacterium RBG_13_46_9]|nr:MAG: hypothetical protein A2Z72_05800 [Omnitrophica bacterium RBG_13_46_9]